MELCASCKTKETALYDNGVPICFECADVRTKRKPPATDQQIRSVLLQDVLELTARFTDASREFEVVTGQIPAVCCTPTASSVSKTFPTNYLLPETS